MEREQLVIERQGKVLGHGSSLLGLGWEARTALTYAT